MNDPRSEHDLEVIKEDWRKQNGLLHIHDNYKFQSVYSRPPAEAIEQYKANDDLADLIIFVMACFVLGTIALITVNWPALRAWFT